MFGACIVLLVGLLTTDGANILVFLPIPAKSHHSVYRPIVRELATRGHNVTYFTPFPVDEPSENLKTILLKIPSKAPLKKDDEAKSFLKGAQESNPVLLTLKTYLMGHMASESMVKLQEVQDLMRSKEKFDLVISAAGYGQQCVSTLGHKFNAPTVQIVPVGDVSFMLDLAGAPDNPAYMMNTHSPFSDRMTFVERLRNVFYWTFNRLIQYYITLVQQKETMDRYLTYPGWEERPSILEMTSDAALILMNSHHSIGYSFPKPPHIKEIGGINVLENKPLPKDIQTFLDSAKDGAIYFSLGSVVSVSDVTGDDMRKAFSNVFRRMKQKVLWKWEAEDFPDKPPNVLTSKWFPQQDVLAHGNLKAFITQGGMMSIYEAVSRGVPLLGIPFFGDQTKNLKHATTYGYGLLLDYANITEKSIQWALEELIHNPRYKTEAVRRAKLFHDRPMRPKDEAAYWIEYVLRHGRVLQPASVRMPLYQLYLIDVLGAIALILTISALILKRIVLYLKSSSSDRKLEKKKLE
uniref:UDP-glucuronosyltransferase n=1 Tax=Lygus hesperus TaxID=30085 RepID=A0A0A9W8L6_LYGHE